MENIRSLSLRTDLLFHRAQGVIVDKKSYLILKMPDNPHYFYGNCLVLKEPPSTKDAKHWVQVHEDAFPNSPSSHKVLLIDSPNGEPGGREGFEELGFELSVLDVLVLNRRNLVSPGYMRDPADVRRLESDVEWKAHLDWKWEMTQRRNNVHETYEFIRRKYDMYRSMCDAGVGDWWVYWSKGKVLGSMGLFFDAEVGRFQDVETDYRHLRTGVCRSLLYLVAKEAFSKSGAEYLVIVPKDDSVSSVYEAVGFERMEKSVDYFREPVQQQRLKRQP